MFLLVLFFILNCDDKRYVMLCYVMLCYVMVCYVMLCYIMLCYVMLCYVMLCYVMLCYVMLQTHTDTEVDKSMVKGKIMQIRLKSLCI